MKGKFIKYISDNKGVAVTVVITVFILFKISRDIVHAVQIKYEISNIEREMEQHQASITRDSTLIEQLKTDEELERYAREKYYMKRDNEDIFIIEL